jgi:Na+/H+-dicarboxylate symporter
MPKITGGTVVKLLIVSLLVGIVLAVLNIDPQNVLQSARDGVESLIEMGASVFGWAFKYVLIGAVVVVPIWLVLYLLRYLRGRR